MSRGRKAKTNDSNLSWQQIFNKNVGKYLQKIIVELSYCDNQSSETGIELLNKIKAEKKQTVKEISPIELEEIRYSIPKNWAWCRLGEIGESTIGVIFKPNQVGTKGVPVLRANNVQNGKIDYSDLILVDIEVREKQIAKIGDILICVRSGSNNLIGKAAIIDKENMSFGAFMTLYRSPINKYVHRFMTSELFKQQIDDKKSTGINQLTQSTLNNILLPLPPLSEQQKIVDFLTDFENDNLKEDGFYFNQEVEQKVIALHEAQLKGFEIANELTHQQTLVKQLRQQLLQEAVQGKLVENDANTEGGYETAHDLLKKIKAEKEQLIKDKKIKKDKELPPIKPEEIPFDIPEDWVWCRLGEIIYNTEGGKSPNCLHEPAKGDEWGVIKTTAVQEMYFLENENKVLPKNFIVNEQHKIIEGDILITRAGPKNRVGIVCYVENLTRNLMLSDKTIRLKHSKELLFSKFIATALNSPLIKPLIELKMTGMADSQVNISQDNMKGFLIPLPPLSIQHQIVAKVDSLMQLCDSLEASIAASARENEALLQQVLREALRPA